MLLVPKRHIASLNDLQPGDDQVVGELVRRAAAIAKERGISAGGFRTVFNTNSDAGQTVFHIHLHLLGGRAWLGRRVDIIAFGDECAVRSLKSGRSSTRDRDEPLSTSVRRVSHSSSLKSHV